MRPGEERPAGEPRRYLAGEGYVRLRWKVGPREYIEVYEHRLVAGNPAGKHVHHENRQRADNDAANLVALTPGDHRAEHESRYAAQAVDLYESGRSTTDIAKLLGIDSSHVYRLLIRRGVAIRSRADRRRTALDVPEIRRLMRDEGWTPAEIARVYDLGVEQVRRVLREAGLRARSGRPTKGEDELRRARDAVHQRSHGRCEIGWPGVCTGRAQHVHHVATRARGGKHDPATMVDSCLPCHRQVHAHPAEAERRGLIIPSGPVISGRLPELPVVHGAISGNAPNLRLGADAPDPF